MEGDGKGGVGAPWTQRLPLGEDEGEEGGQSALGFDEP